MKKFVSIILTLNMCWLIGTNGVSFATDITVDHMTGAPIVSARENSCKNVPPVSWANILNGSFLFLGGTCALGSLFSFLTTAGSVAWGFSQIHSLKYCYEDVKELCHDTYILLKNKVTYTRPEPDKTITALKEMFKEIKGQETPKSAIERSLAMIAHDKNFSYINNQKYGHADIMLFVGASGVGKSLAAAQIAKSLCEEPLVLSAADVDRRAQETVIQQLFAPVIDNYAYGASLKKAKSLARYLKAHPGRGVIIINESDKLNPNGELDEILRGAMDNGIVNIQGQVFDFSGALIILTSNESSSCVNKGNFSQPNPEDEDDGTGSRTIATHDKSFLNRVKIVEFDNLTKGEYFEIAKNEFSQKVLDYWKKYAGIELVIPDETYEKIAARTEKENKGARVLNRIRADLVKKVIEKTEKKGEKFTSSSQKYFVYYNPQLGEFELSAKLVPDYYLKCAPEVPANATIESDLSQNPDLNMEPCG